MQRFWPYALALAAAAGIVWFSVDSGLIPMKDLLPPVLAVFGTFFGALFAYRLNERKEEIKTEADQASALKQVTFFLALQHGALSHILEGITQYREPIERAFNCPGIQHSEFSQLEIQLSSLNFLLQDKEGTLLLARIANEQWGFFQALESIRLRSTFYVEELTPVISEKKLNKRSHSEGELEAALGERLFHSAIQYAHTMYTMLGECIPKLEQLHRDTYAYAKQKFPDEKFVVAPVVPLAEVPPDSK